MYISRERERERERKPWSPRARCFRELLVPEKFGKQTMNSSCLQKDDPHVETPTPESVRNRSVRLVRIASMPTHLHGMGSEATIRVKKLSRVHERTAS